jgi:DNA polymerase-4
VVEHRERKSVSAETTLARDTGDPETLHELADRLSQRVARHLSRTGLRGYTVKLKLRLSDFTTFTRQTTLAEAVESPEEIARAAGELLDRELAPDRLFRLVGVGVSGFERPEESLLQPRLAGFE